MDKNAVIYVAGHRGLVGSAIVRRLEAEGYTRIIVRSHAELDLTRQAAVEDFLAATKPEYVFLAAAKVGGIGANSAYPAEFFHTNMAIALNVIQTAYDHGVKKLLNLGSSCIYPRLAPQPLKEEQLLTAPLEPTNEAYAVAKIAAIKMCRYYNDQYGTNYLSAMPTNLYGPGDNYHPENSHVLPALIHKFHEAKIRRETATLWGDGSPLREFLHADDLADVAIKLMRDCDYADIGELINVGSGDELTIKELAILIAEIVGYHGGIEWDTSKPNGTPRKRLDLTKLFALGWRPRVTLRRGIAEAYKDYLVRIAG